MDERRPAVVLVDLLMPGTDGFGVLQGIKRRPRGLRPGRVIVMSGVDDPVVEKGVYRLGADRVLNEPYHLTDLREALIGQLVTFLQGYGERIRVCELRGKYLPAPSLKNRLLPPLSPL